MISMFHRRRMLATTAASGTGLVLAVVVTAGLVLTLTTGCAQPVAADRPATVQLQPLSYDELQQLIAGKRGQVVVVDAWSTSCPPCMKEFPHLVELSRKYQGRVACVSVSCDYEGIGTLDEVREPVLKFLTAQKATFDNVLARDDSETMFRRLGIASIPAVFVYDQTGKQVGLFDGERFSYQDVEAEVGKLLGK